MKFVLWITILFCSIGVLGSAAYQIVFDKLDHVWTIIFYFSQLILTLRAIAVLDLKECWE